MVGGNRMAIASLSFGFGGIETRKSIGHRPRNISKIGENMGGKNKI